MSDAVASISAITFSAPSTNATAPSPVVCSALPSGAASRQSPIATSARFAPPLTASAPCSIADMPARTEPVMSEARISAGSCAAAPITAALSFSAYGGVVVAKISACTSPGGAAFSASRAASTAIETLSSSKLAIARSPLPAGVPSTAAIAERLSRR